MTVRWMGCASLIALAACQASVSDASSGSSKLSACGSAPAQTGYLSRSMTVAGKVRTYDLYVPPGVTGREPLPLVFVFHQSDGTIQIAENYGIQTATAAAGGKAIFVFPQGLDTGLGVGVGWDPGCTAYDMRFFDAMVAATEVEECIDARRIFTTGYSAGAEMTVATGCCRGDVVRAIATTSGAIPEPAPCTATRPAYRATIGTADVFYSVAAVHAVTEDYRQAQGCGTATVPASPSPPCLAYTGCGAPVIECVYPDMEHWFPPDGQAHVWEFLSGF